METIEINFIQKTKIAPDGMLRVENFHTVQRLATLISITYRSS